MAKILLVEDNKMLQEILAERLSFRDHDVIVASDGEEGFTLAKREVPDIILMDMSLPIMDGWETTRQIRATAATTHIPIIALTAHALSGDRERSLEAGCNEYETKPVNFNQLVAKIEELIAASS